jgi:hypothetical protein
MDRSAEDPANGIVPSNGFKDFWASATFIGFTLITGVICIFVLSATLTQARISSLAIEGVSLSIWKLDTVRQQWATIRDQQQKQSKALGDAEIRRAETSGQKTAAESEYNIALNDLVSLLEEFNFRAKPFDAGLAAAISGQSPAEQVGRIEAAAETLRVHPELVPYLQRIRDDHAKFQAAAVQRTTKRGTDTAVVNEISNLKFGLQGSKESLEALFGTIKSNLDEAGRSRIESALYELQPTAGWLSRLHNKLMTTQPDVLTLFLVILMGVLGSALQITHAFFIENRVESPGSYVLRVCVGAITALVIFIVAKAGVPVIADATKLGGEAPINPYFVSFIAILSGLLSENAIASVQAQGAKFFGTDVPGAPDRWARDDLNSLFLQTPDLSLKAIGEYLGTTEDVTKSILSGKMQATPEQQKTISLYLHRQLRDLFSDMPPATA